MNDRSFTPEVAAAPLDRREAVLNAALELFGERGFHGTTVPLVAARAGVAAGTMYRYFESKEALVNAVFQREKEAVARTLLQDFPFELPVREQFHALWRRYASFAIDRPASFAFLELHHHAPYLDARSMEVEATLLETTKRFAETWQAQRVIKTLAPAILISIVYGSFAALVKASRMGYLAIDDETLDGAERCVWEAIRL